MALQGHIVIPTEPDKSEKVIDEIKAGAVVRFGGFSEYDGCGGWEGEHQIVEEDHTRIVINLPEDSNYDEERFKTYMRIEAEYVKNMLDQDAVMLEFQEIGVEFV